MFNVSAVAVGQLNGTVPAVALSTIAEGYSAELESQQEAQQLGRECGELQYRISTNETTIQIDIKVNYEREPGRQDVVIKKISVTFNDCPLGFKLLPKIGRCDCIDFLSEKGITCNIDHQSFQRPVPVWIGYRDEKILVHDTCPLDYCKTYSTEVTVNTTDQLCAFSRSGILCGGCKQGLSLVFATSQCHKCSNSYLALLLVFITLGFVLVLVMIYGDLTISKGTLNGLIFYANIVQVNRNVIFPAGHSNILTVFIAWLNLDFGIETCFYNGMDDYGRTWLQFLFPIYIWVLVVLIIIASWYSSLAAKITGSNVLAVLATLFLLSYTKLQRTVLTAFSFTLVTTHDDNTFPVWLYDGNVPLFGPKHAVLFVMAVIATVCFILPFTLLVLFGPLLQAKFSRYMLRLWLTPILDAYQGPYKDRFRCWTGVMLVVRSFLLLVFAMNALGTARLNLMLIVSVTIILLAFTWNAGTIYQKFVVNIIESFYILNLGLLSAWTEFNRQDMDSAKYVQKQAAISYTLVGTAFVGFLAIAGYHLALQVRRFKNSRYWCWAEQETDQPSQLQPVDDRTASPSPVHIPVPPTVSYIDVYEQESLLSDTLDSEQ